MTDILQPQKHSDALAYWPALQKLRSRHHFEINELKPATDAFKRNVSLPVSVKYLRDA